ncbi:MAG: hypothetical protein PHH23_05645 [Paludibacteraceae bacterium]|nr:hypothetical protein [Paludibacteraceae bacterium]
MKSLTGFWQIPVPPFAIDMVVLRTTEDMVNCKFVDMVVLRTTEKIQLYIRNSPMPVRASVSIKKL